jgi:hypothetical protein
LDHARDVKFELDFYGGHGDGSNGVFRFMSCEDAKPMAVIASVGDGWDHVSVSRPDRCPTYDEMEQIAKAFFKDDEAAVQYHVPAKDHVNVHRFCLHWWRPTYVKLVRPPGYMIGPKA